ncbi:peptidyl-prolyl cis-trans isomerase CYP95-like isoform X1 [Tripterygium wilfordii]|uniref:peptidyl-prolyl cis-trans isomerase CYP95-like isoform X1 n=1 Tax=Tripterygium wilfordii TaxID=458696 RepID=UPI0018F84BAA|nr:peptidyl-prolyl cis-trans isomerase CYP95-like isoform X1 [Tripterygium wilfordii]XP_038711018.1 peptidyl-prolyl cis-trans isomerase CYP95-like isoform X1 [Tripterygium wilfordii]
MAKKKNTLVFMDVSIDGDPIERMVFELFYDVAPKTAENFRSLCTGEKGIGPKTGRPLHFKGTFFHRIMRGSMAEGGDLLRQDGAGGESIYGGNFPDESPQLKHEGPGLLSMSISDRDNSGSIFIITFKASQHLDRKHIVFGKLVKGDEVLKKIEDAGDEEGRPAVTVKVIKCGEFDEDVTKVSKLKAGTNASREANSHEIRKRGKHKKSSRDRRKKRRRYYSSDTESSSDSETESSESDSDSDSSLLSSTDDTSSSDDRRKKRKRSSKRDKYRRLKRRDRKRDKKRKRRDKRSKHRSRRASDSESESKSGSSSDDGIDAQGEDKKCKDLSQKTAAVQSLVTGEEETISTRRKLRAEAGIIEKESSRSPKENGERHSNGIEADAKSNGSADREPDVVDDHPGKSRSRSMSPKRTMSKSISPRRSMSRSPTASPKRSMSRSPSVGRSPPPVTRRSLSRSPARKVSSRSPSISRSPVRGRKGRSISRSPVRVQSRRSSSRSPMKSLSRRSLTRSPARTSSLRYFSRSPVRSSRRSISRSSGRAPSRRSISRSPIKPPSRNTRRSYSRSPSPVPRARSPPARGRSLSRSVSPDGSSKRIRRGRGFSQRYSFARKYRTPSPDRSPVRSYRYSGRVDRDRYSSYRRYSPRRYRSPPRGRTPPRYRSRRSRTRSPSVSRRRSRTRSPSVSRSPPYRSRRFSRSPIQSRSPVEVSRSRASPQAERRRSPLRRRSPTESHSSLESHSPRRPSKDVSRSSSGSPGNKKGLVSYDDGSPDSGQR